jgi:hypothetical protein
MIDFVKYDIKIVGFAIHVAGIWPPEYAMGEGSPLLVTQNVWLRKDYYGHVYEQDWKQSQQIIEKWCEKHRGQSLIVHDMNIFGIRYAIVPDTETKGKTYAA